MKEMRLLISRHSFILFSFFALFCRPSLSLPKLLKTPTTSYLVSSLLLYKISAFLDTHLSHPAPALSPSFTLFFPPSPLLSPASFLLVARLLLLSVLFNFKPGFLSASAQSQGFTFKLLAQNTSLNNISSLIDLQLSGSLN